MTKEEAKKLRSRGAVEGLSYALITEVIPSQNATLDDENLMIVM